MHLPIALLYWFPIFFFYHAKTLNSWQEWSTPSMYPSFNIIAKMLIPVVIARSSSLEIAISVIILLGIAVFLCNILRKQYYQSFHSFFLISKKHTSCCPWWCFLPSLSMYCIHIQLNHCLALLWGIIAFQRSYSSHVMYYGMFFCFIWSSFLALNSNAIVDG